MAPSMWQQTEDLAKKLDQNSGLWLKLANDGDKAVVVFLGEPHPREVCFVENKYLPFDDQLKAQGHKPSLRVALNVALYDSQEVKVLEQGVLFFKDLVRIRDKYGLDKWAFEICRHGAAKDPKTTYSILPEHQLSPAQQKAFQALALQDLGKLYSGEASGETPSPGRDARPAAATTTTIDAKLAQAIATELKSMPREAVDRFLERFSVQRIRDVPAARANEARELIEHLRRELVDPFADDAVDPFAD